MSENLYYLMIGLVMLVFLMFFRPFRDLVLGIFGAKSVWGLLWFLFSTIFVAHFTVLRNFLPRSVVLPTLDTRKTTNADD